uniref:UBA domain-containing protein n=1 Tax=Heterorhabditis bacteriophora TaxID=37862 RepID=A0A1I7WSH4_HETBA
MLLAVFDRLSSLRGNQWVNTKELNMTPDKDVRVGRHRDKLELIRDSLKPFEQTAGEQSQPATVTEQQRMMDALVAQGYDRDVIVQQYSIELRSDFLYGIYIYKLLLSTVPTHSSNLPSNGNSQFNQNMKMVRNFLTFSLVYLQSLYNRVILFCSFSVSIIYFR